MKHPYVLLDEMLHEAHQVQKLEQEQAEALVVCSGSFRPQAHIRQKSGIHHP